MWHYYYELMRWIDRMSIQEWMLLAIVAIFLGLACLRGRNWAQ